MIYSSAPEWPRPRAPQIPSALCWHPHHTFPWPPSSPSPPLTSFKFECSTTLKVVSTFKATGIIFLKEKWECCGRWGIVACGLGLGSWSGEIDRRPSWQGHPPTHPMSGPVNHPREPSTAAVTAISKGRDLHNDGNDIFLAGSLLWVSLICLTYTVTTNQSALKAKTQKLL